jgi:hypothetical protein
MTKVVSQMEQIVQQKADEGSRTPVTSLGSSGNSRYTTSAKDDTIIAQISFYCQLGLQRCGAPFLQN